MHCDIGEYGIEFFEDCALLFRVPDRKLIELNASGADILKGLLENASVDAIVETMRGKYNIDEHVARADIKKIIDCLDKIGLHLN
jgi:hypothetical protein